MRERLRQNYGWVVVAAVTTMLTITSGARFLYGVVLKSMSEEFHWSRSSMTAAVLINMLVLSALQPVFGMLTDRIGPRRILLFGSVSLGLALIPFSYVTSLWQVYAIQGILLPVGLAAVSPVNVTGLVSRWFHARRGAAMSIATSGSAFGQLLIVPLAAWMLTTTDWSMTYRMMGILILVAVTPIGLIFLRDAPTRALPEHVEPAHEEKDHLTGWSLREAVSSSSFWQLAFGFFVCGFTMAFANTHFMAFADDMGMSEIQAANVISVTAIFSIGGSILLGLAADRYGRSRMLGLTYALRGLAFFLLIPFSHSALIFAYAVVLGMSWTATTPLTAAISADAYGRRNIGVIFGTMFTWMNIGFGAGSFLDGVIYDISGAYTVALAINGVLGVLAALTVIQVRPVRPRLVEDEAAPIAPSAAPAD